MSSSFFRAQEAQAAEPTAFPSTEKPTADFSPFLFAPLDVDHFPFGADFGWTNYGDLTGDSVGWVRTHPVAGGTYLNQTSQVHDKVSCCNYAMSQGRAAGGFWMPADFFGRPRCYVFNVPDGDKQACQPDKVKYTLLSYPADRNFTGYYAL